MAEASAAPAKPAVDAAGTTIAPAAATATPGGADAAATEGEGEGDEKERWKALESNPDILNELAHTLGVPDEYTFNEVFGLEDDLLAMVPQPVLAFIVLYPPATVAAEKDKDITTTATATATPAAVDVAATPATATPAVATPAPAAAAGATTTATAPSAVGAGAGVRGDATSERKESKAVNQHGMFFMRQVAALYNACGTVAAVHAITNAALTERIPLTSGSPLARWIPTVTGKTPQERGDALDANEEIEQCHSKLAAEGQSATLSEEAEEQVELHFACFTASPGAAGTGEVRLIELDGIKEGPVDHGVIPGATSLAAPGSATKEWSAASGSALLRHAVATIRTAVIAHLGGDIRISMIALCGPIKD